MKRRLVLALIVICGITAVYFHITSMIENRTVVEHFCSVKHQHNVDEYKACRMMTPNKLLIKLTQDEENRYGIEVPTISLAPLK